MIRIAILDDYQQVALGIADWSSLQGAEVVSFARQMSGDELVAALADFDVAVAVRERATFSADVIERLPKLKLIASTGMRNAAIDLAACKRAGIVVSGSRGARNGLAVTAESAWALILALHKRVVIGDTATRQGIWQPEVTAPLDGRVLGLVGLGNIGQHMARIGRAFGMEVIAWSPNLTDERATAGGARRVDKSELFSTADVVSVHMVLASSTAGIVSAPELAAMKASAFIVNTARAGLIDEQALLAALRDRRIAGAGLDVFWEEPLPRSHELCSLDNVVMTPHTGYVTQENLAAYYKNVVKAIGSWMRGEMPPLLE